MHSRARVHLATTGLLLLLVGILALFWSFPQMLIYVLLGIVALLAYGALYLILAARMDPTPKRATAPSIEPYTDEPTITEVAPQSGGVASKKRRASTKKKSGTKKKGSTQKVSPKKRKST